MPTPKYFSVTFQILDEAKFKKLSSQFISEMADGCQAVEEDPPYTSKDEERGYSVIACGRGDFATQADAYAAELDGRNVSTEEALRSMVETEYPEHTSEEVDALVKGILG